MKILIQTLLLLIASNLSLYSKAADEEDTSQENTAAEDSNTPQDPGSIADEPKSSNAETEENAEEQQPEPLRHIPRITDKRSASLLDHMTSMSREDEVVTLSSLEETFYGLYLPQASGQPQGGILILHDEQQHGHWPDIIGPLREYLPLFGWSTLTIELPDQLKRQRIPRETSPLADMTNQDPEEQKSNDDVSPESEKTALLETDNAEDEEAKDNAGPETNTTDDMQEDNTEIDDNESALPRLDKLPELPAVIKENEALEEEKKIDRIAEYQAQNRQRINTAIEYLQQQNQFNLVVIGFGRGGSWAVDYIHQQTQLIDEPKGLTLITIDVLPNIYSKDLINQQLADISVPYLDLLQSKKHVNNKSAAKRLSIMRRNNNPNYQQIITPEISSYNELENATNRRIRGWIKTNASGTKIAIKP